MHLTPTKDIGTEDFEYAVREAMIYDDRLEVPNMNENFPDIYWSMWIRFQKDVLNDFK